MSRAGNTDKITLGRLRALRKELAPESGCRIRVRLHGEAEVDARDVLGFTPVWRYDHRAWPMKNEIGRCEMFVFVWDENLSDGEWCAEAISPVEMLLTVTVRLFPWGGCELKTDFVWPVFGSDP